MGTAKDFPPGRLHPHLRRIRSFPKVFLAHLNTSVRRKSPQKHFFARHSATGVTGAGAAASPSAAENRSFKLTFYVNFFQLAKEQHIHTTLDTAGQPFTTAEPFFSRLTTLF